MEKIPNIKFLLISLSFIVGGKLMLYSHNKFSFSFTTHTHTQMSKKENKNRQIFSERLSALSNKSLEYKGELCCITTFPPVMNVYNISSFAWRELYRLWTEWSLFKYSLHVNFHPPSSENHFNLLIAEVKKFTQRKRERERENGSFEYFVDEAFRDFSVLSFSPAASALFYVVWHESVI